MAFFNDDFSVGIMGSTMQKRLTMKRYVQLAVLLTVSALQTAYAQNDLTNKVMMGYQGWFNTPGDGSPVNEWRHWFKDQTPNATRINIDFWPEMVEYPQQYATEMTYQNGSMARLFSSYDQSTVNVHFQWMRDYNVHGVYVQRFLGEAASGPQNFQNRNHIMENVMNAAQTYGRHYAVMYDVTGVPEEGFYDKLINDWKYLVDTYDMLNRPGHARQEGKPVVAIWGMGFSHNPVTYQTAQAVIDFFHNGPEKYRAYVVGGVPSYWRTLRTQSDTKTEPQWAAVYRSFDMISPWTVGRYNKNSVDAWKTNMIVPDLADCHANGIDYMPVIWPGGSWFNQTDQLYPERINDNPRDGGNNYWRQAYNAISAGSNFLYVAMFDEVDEGTAMFKVAPNAGGAPAQGTIVNLDADGFTLPSDWYLRLADESQKMLDHSIPLTSTIPIAPSFNVPVVYVSSTSPAVRGVLPGSFTIAATNVTSPVTVAYTLGGTAPAADYTATPALTGSVTLTPSAPLVSVTVAPATDHVITSGETLQLTLAGGSGYTIGSATAAITFHASAPFDGSPAAIPGRVEAENYDAGGPGVAYYDTDGVNNGGQYRASEPVDIGGAPEGGYFVGWLSKGEWLAYTVNVASAGVYTLEARVATPASGKSFHVELNGVNISGSIAVPATGDWQAYQTVRVTTPMISAGQKVVRIVMDTDGFNLNDLNFVLSTPGQGPYTGTPAVIPGRIEAENYDTGGQGIAYSDQDVVNSGGQYRAEERVDIESCSEGGYNVGWIGTGEWLEYTVNVTSAGTYTLQARVATPHAGKTFHVELDGVNISGPVAVPNTGNWQVYQTVSVTTPALTTGVKVLRIFMDGFDFNINYINFVRHGTGRVALVEDLVRGEEITYSPNPVQDMFTINFPPDVFRAVSVRDVLGRVQYQQVIDAHRQDVTLQLVALPSGTYFVSLENGARRKVIKVVKR
jgi:hypothetical protein